MKSRFPELYRELEAVVRKIELHLCDMQDIEFTIENNTLYLLQTRPAKRTNHAALKVAIDLANEGIIDRRLAVTRLDEAGLKQLLLPVFSPSAPKRLIAKGNPASPGVASGKLAFNRRDAIKRAQAGEDIILVADRTTPNDIGSIAASRGVLTREGGMTSHAAINSRRMAKPCVTGCETLDIDKEAEILRVDSFELGPGTPSALMDTRARSSSEQSRSSSRNTRRPFPTKTPGSRTIHQHLYSSGKRISRNGFDPRSFNRHLFI